MGFYRQARLLLTTSGRAKLVNATSIPAQEVGCAFVIVKAARRKILGIIKETEICSVKITAKIEEFFTIKHFGKIIKEQIFTVI